MKLWSFQSKEAVALLKTDGILRVNLERYRMKAWKAAYQWMSKQMENRGIKCNGFAPIWAWHSCGEWEKSPTIGDAANLLSIGELELGIYTLEFSCPDKLALLTDYSAWNSLLDYFFDGEYDPQLSTKEQQALFNTQLGSEDHRESLQATLPYLKLEWVEDIRPLQFDADDEHLDYDQLV